MSLGGDCFAATVLIEFQGSLRRLAMTYTRIFINERSNKRRSAVGRLLRWGAPEDIDSKAQEEDL